MAGRTTQDGYGWEHQRLRRKWEPVVKAGGVACWRCGEPIAPDAKWHLGHDDVDRSVYRGPEHPKCNLGTSGRVANSTDVWRSEEW